MSSKGVLLRRGSFSRWCAELPECPLAEGVDYAADRGEAPIAVSMPDSINYLNWYLLEREAEVLHNAGHPLSEELMLYAAQVAYSAAEYSGADPADAAYLASRNIYTLMSGDCVGVHHRSLGPWSLAANRVIKDKTK